MFNFRAVLLNLQKQSLILGVYFLTRFPLYVSWQDDERWVYFCHHGFVELYLSTYTQYFLFGFRFDKLLYLGIPSDRESQLNILTALTRK